MKIIAVALLSLVVVGCAPRFGHDPLDSDILPVRVKVFRDHRYVPPTKSYIPQNLPLGTLKQVDRPTYVHHYDPDAVKVYMENQRGRD